MNPVRLGVVMDPIDRIHPKKDSTLAMLQEAQSRGWSISYMELCDLRLRDGRAEATSRELNVRNESEKWFEFGPQSTQPLSDLDVILMRKDPPFDMEYIVATYILEQAERERVLVVNPPGALRDANEKIFTAWFPECCPPSLLSRNKSALKDFLETYQTIVVKPVDSMGGRSVFVLRKGDPNLHVILEETTGNETRFVQAQAYIEEVEESGDKRILLIDGIPIEHCVARIPADDDHRANLASGGTARASELTETDRAICDRIGPELKRRGLMFVGIDVIGQYLTEVNVTSPTCIREIDRFFGVSVAGVFLEAIEKRLAK